MDGGDRDFHKYQYRHRINGADQIPQYVLEQILRENGVPNPWQKPASADGARNDAADLFRGPLPASQVKTYERISNDGQRWVVNVTRSVLDGNSLDGGLHFLSPGWVATTLYRNDDGSVDILTYGEGVWTWQSKRNPAVGLFDWVDENVWNERAGHVQQDVDRAIRNYNRTGVWKW
jgi:hypothetical protein